MTKKDLRTRHCLANRIRVICKRFSRTTSHFVMWRMLVKSAADINESTKSAFDRTTIGTVIMKQYIFLAKIYQPQTVRTWYLQSNVKQGQRGLNTFYFHKKP